MKGVQCYELFGGIALKNHAFSFFHCWKIPEAREELNRSVREGRIESRHSIKSLEGMGSISYDLGAEIRMHSFTVNCDTFSNEEKVAAVVPVTSVDVTCSEAMLALSFST